MTKRKTKEGAGGAKPKKPRAPRQGTPLGEVAMRDRITIRLDEATERSIATIALREGRTFADVTRRLVRASIDRYEAGEKAPQKPKVSSYRTPKEALADAANAALVPIDDILARMLEQVVAGPDPKSSLIGGVRRADIEREPVLGGSVEDDGDCPPIQDGRKP